MPTLHAIDLSHHNTVTSLKAAKDSGVIGVIHKATEGTSFVDKQYASRKASAKAAGLKWATYHFLKHGNVDAQIKHYLATAQPVPGERVVIDYEDAACTLDDLRAAVTSIINRDPTLQVTVYAGHLLKEQLGSKVDSFLAATTSLWIAQYNNTGPKWPQGTWPVYSLWQFTDKASVPGISGPCDGNEFNGSAEACAAWFGPAGEPKPEPGPEPGPEEEGVVAISITVPDSVRVDIKVNGNPWNGPA